tara:strand:- start:1241 stop:1900 length:660 start_codon:yes stop_codon:yes gene_type:complete
MKIPSSWTFKSKEVAKNFDSHVREQLPWYNLATFICRHYIRAYARTEDTIYDMGCSTGNMELACEDIIATRNLRWMPVDESEEMLKRYKGKCTPTIQKMQTLKFKEGLDGAVCFLSLMFLTKSARESFLQRMFFSLSDDGFILIFDKFLSKETGYISMVESQLASAIKKDNNLDASEILEKEISLLGAQVPMEYHEISKYSPRLIFKLGQFEGYIITKL